MSAAVDQLDCDAAERRAGGGICRPPPTVWIHSTPAGGGCGVFSLADGCIAGAAAEPVRCRVWVFLAFSAYAASAWLQFGSKITPCPTMSANISFLRTAPSHGLPHDPFNTPSWDRARLAGSPPAPPDGGLNSWRPTALFSAFNYVPPIIGLCQHRAKGHAAQHRGDG